MSPPQTSWAVSEFPSCYLTREVPKSLRPGTPTSPSAPISSAGALRGRPGARVPAGQPSRTWGHPYPGSQAPRKQP